MKGIRVLVAGAAGGFALPLVERLVAGGHEVTGLTRSPRRARAVKALGADAVLCDVMLERQLTDAVKRARPEAVIQLLTSVPPRPDPNRYTDEVVPALRLLGEGAHNVLTAAREAAVSRVLAQSIAYAYAPEGDWVKDERAELALDAPPPQDELVAAVAELERRVLDADGIVLRYGHAYGPGTHFSADGTYGALASQRKLPVFAAAEGRWSFVHAADAATATVAVLDRGSRGVYNVVDDEPAIAREWIPAFAEAIGAKRPRKLPDAIGSRLLDRVALEAMSRQRGASNAKIRRELDWRPEHTTWRDGFKAALGGENGRH